ncbi:MAG: hypothetical protein NZV14_15775 [Bryobacteraceae bacterium]|nr:hypothetical protein [Bryobacteraceae bacterium]MDW8379620.1 hypothetical protein [Bryobacterales bacterium]
MRAELVAWFKGQQILDRLIYLGAILLFGVVVPWQLGFSFLDVGFLLAYILLPCLFAPQAVATLVSSRHPQPPGPGYVAQILAPMAAGVATHWLILALGFSVVSFRGEAPRLLLPPWQLLLHTTLLGLAATFLACSLAGWITLNSKTLASAKKQARQIFLLILAGVMLWLRLGPAGAKGELIDRLNPQRIHTLALPVSLGLAILGGLFLQAGRKRRMEEFSGPIFKL